MNDDILKLKNQYNTLIGENGILLSGGQKQRISIARALILKPEILILDDALSAVDGNTEKNILKNILQWKSKKTTIIMSSHKISTLRKANEIIIMKKGKIVDRGTHFDLMKKKNWYSDSLSYKKNYEKKM